MAGLERRYEAKHLQQMQAGANRLSRMLRANAEQLAQEIAVLQSKQLKDPAKYGAQLKRNKRLQKQIQAQFNQLEEDLFNEINSQTSEQWALANKKNNILVNSYITGSVDQKYTQLNLDALNQFQKRFQGGKQLSDRVHNLTEINKQLYNDYIGTGITQGRSSAAIARDLDRINTDPYNVKVFDKDGNPTTLKKISPILKPNAKGRGIYRSPRKNLFRLTRTETNAAYRLSDYERMQQLDFVVGYTVHLSASHNIADMCDFLAGDYPKKFKFSGWHPACFCYVTSILKTKKEFAQGLKSKNEVKRIPRSAQRYQKSVKNKQYYDWQKDNFKNDVPYKKVGGASSGIEPYKISTDPKDYKPKNKILKSAAKSVV
jgi:hypothetical protein